MYTNQQWIDMLEEVNSFAIRYESIEMYYSELDDKKKNTTENIGGLVALAIIGAVIFGFVKFGWLKGVIILVIGIILYGIYDDHIIKKKEEKKLLNFEEKYGEKMKELEIEKESMEKQRRDMEESESYIACKSNLPSECMDSSWYRSYETEKRMKIQSALKKGAETLEKAIELMQKSNS